MRVSSTSSRQLRVTNGGILRHRALQDRSRSSAGRAGRRRSLAIGIGSSRCAYSAAMSELRSIRDAARQRLEEQAAEARTGRRGRRACSPRICSGDDVVDRAKPLPVGRAALGGRTASARSRRGSSARGRPARRSGRSTASRHDGRARGGEPRRAPRQPAPRSRRRAPGRASPSRRSSAFRSVPSTKRMAMKRRPSASPVS